ncbi:unnamed protein product [Closterium sp. Yama58-4]|nr:unnamed protein product [Closterium sp. Yama58-4]
MAIGVPAEIMELQRKRSRTSNRRLEGYELGSPTTGTRRTSTPAQQVGTPSALPAQPPPLQDLEALDAEHTAENGVASPHDASNATAPVAQRGAAANVVASAGTGALRSSDRDVHHPEANSYNHIDAAIRGDLQDVRTLMLRIENRLHVSDEIHQTLAATVKNLLEIVHQPSWCNEKTMEDACKKACDDLLKGSDVSQRVIYPDEDQFRAAVVVHLALDPEDFGKFNDYWKKGEWAKKCTDICNGRRGKLGNKSRKASFKLLKYPDNKAVKDSVEDRRDYARSCVSEEFGLPWHVFEDKPFCSEAVLAAASKWQKKEGDVYTLSIDQLCYTMVAEGFQQIAGSHISSCDVADGVAVELTVPGTTVQLWDGATLKWEAARMLSGTDLVDVYDVKIDGVATIRLTLRPEVKNLRTPTDAAVHFGLDVLSSSFSKAVHGVLGQTFRPDFQGRLAQQKLQWSDLLQVMVVPGDNAEGFIDGSMDDYEVTDLLKADCKMCRFTRAHAVDEEMSIAMNMMGSRRRRPARCSSQIPRTELLKLLPICLILLS